MTITSMVISILIAYTIIKAFKVLLEELGRRAGIKAAEAYRKQHT